MDASHDGLIEMPESVWVHFPFLGALVFLQRTYLLYKPRASVSGWKPEQEGSMGLYVHTNH